MDHSHHSPPLGSRRRTSLLTQHTRTRSVTSLVTLRPMVAGLLLWNRLGESMITHWGFDGQPDGVFSRAFGVFALPLIMLAAHWLCVGLTTLDHKNAQRNPKPFRVLLWVIPITSNLCCGMMYTLALGLPVSPAIFMNGFLGILFIAIKPFRVLLWVIPITSNLCCGMMYTLALGLPVSPAIFMNGFLGILFIAIGNYLPKCSQNRTMGIKLPWTFRSVENWNATHRFGGRVWVIGGVVILFSALLPGGWLVGVMVVSIFALTLIPVVYSYLYYRRQVRRGDTFTPMVQSEQEKKFAKAFSIGTLIFVPLLLIFLLVVLFTGHVEVSFSQDYFTVDASFYDDLVVYYDRVESVSYHRSVENWNATHRFGGRVWVIGGVVILFSALLPGGWLVGVMVVSIFALTLIPVVYSYLYYRRQVRRGDTFTPMVQSEQEKKFAKAFSIGTLIFVPLLLIFLLVVLFTGHVEVSFSQDYFTVDASFYDDLVVYYDRVESVSYHQGNIPGTRTFGVGSLRLLLGQFENQELGPYTRYTYYDPESCVLLYVNGKPLVLSGRDDAETQQLYHQLLEKTH